MIGRQINGLEGFNIHLDQANERAAKVGAFPATSSTITPSTATVPTVRPHNIDRFTLPVRRG